MMRFFIIKSIYHPPNQFKIYQQIRPIEISPHFHTSNSLLHLPHTLNTLFCQKYTLFVFYSYNYLMLRDYDEGYKVIIAGSSGVGKSSLLLRFVDNIFSENLLSTIGVDFKFKTFEIKGKKIKMQIWDTAGSETFRSIVSAYYRGANAVVLVYAMDDKNSFQDMRNFWIEEVNKYRQDDCEIMILGNKSDQGYEAVKETQVEQFMKQYKIGLFKEVSAKTGDQVGEAFKVLGQKLMSKVRRRQSDRGKVGLKESKMSHPDVPEGSDKKKGCCK